MKNKRPSTTTAEPAPVSNLREHTGRAHAVIDPRAEAIDTVQGDVRRFGKRKHRRGNAGISTR